MFGSWERERKIEERFSHMLCVVSTVVFMEDVAGI
jgi:hypothetical protein